MIKIKEFEEVKEFAEHYENIGREKAVEEISNFGKKRNRQAGRDEYYEGYDKAVKDMRDYMGLTT